MFPDLLVGLFTGVVVGLVILGAERRMRARRALADEHHRMWSVARATSISHPFIYEGSTLLPNDRGLRRLVKQVSPVGLSQPDAWATVPGYEYLARVARSWEAMQASVEEIDRILGRTYQVKLDPSLTDYIRSAVFFYASIDRSAWEPERAVILWSSATDATRSNLRQIMADPKLLAVVSQYSDAREALEAWRQAYIATREHVRKADDLVRDLYLEGAVGATRAERRVAIRRARLIQKNTNTYSYLAGREAYEKVGPEPGPFRFDGRRSWEHPGLNDEATSPSESGTSVEAHR